MPFLKKNDAESVAVAPGCKLIGYDHNDEDSVEGRGDYVVIDARRSRRVVAKYAKNLR